MHIHCSDFLLQGARLTDSPSGWALNWSLCQSHCPHGFCQPTTKWVTCTDTDLFPSSRGFFWWVMLVLEFLTDLLQALEAKWRLRISMSTLLSSLPSSLWSDLNCTFFFLATLRGMWDLHSLTRDWTPTLALEAWNLSHWPPWKSPWIVFSKFFLCLLLPPPSPK